MSRVASELCERVHRANQTLVESGLVTETFGNVSAVDRDAGVFLIKPSGEIGRASCRERVSSVV